MELEENTTYKIALTLVTTQAVYPFLRAVGQSYKDLFVIQTGLGHEGVSNIDGYDQSSGVISDIAYTMGSI